MNALPTDVSLVRSRLVQGKDDLGLPCVTVMRAGSLLGVVVMESLWGNRRWQAESSYAGPLNYYPTPLRACQAVIWGRPLTPTPAQLAERHRRLLRASRERNAVLARLEETGELLVVPGDLVAEQTAADQHAGRAPRWTPVLTREQVIQPA